ncbi:MAG TPA: class I tRNA ligase family protein [Acidimicrobiales bacterium]|nr:class I tRNA ligase family protein [Acidimicrobiales bacterium]
MSSEPANPVDPTADDAPAHRYGAGLANEIEARWQDRWAAQGTYHAPNPTGPLAEGAEPVSDRPKFYVLDMFPYPSGTGLHVGHPLGYIGTDVYARFKRMTGHNVLHAMGYDAFGLPAEQYAVQTGQHPRVTTEANIATIRAQFRALGLGHDDRRSVATTDVEFYRWTQWIFLQIFGAWYDSEADRARPIDELVAELESGERAVIDDEHPDGRRWADLDDAERRKVVDDHRLVYLDDAPVNWCPGLGTVLANEEVTPEGRSERGNLPVYKRPLRQWKMRITAYAERLLDDLELIDWPEPITIMQRNWIGRSQGARVEFPLAHDPETSVPVFTTRPDTLFGATYMVLAPEHPLVDQVVAGSWGDVIPASWRGAGLAGVVDDVPASGWETPSEAVAGYRRYAERRTDIERQTESRVKTGVFTGSYAVNPANGEPVPVFIADYVLMGYGTGAIMAVPAHDHRDFEFARAFDLDIVGVVAPSTGWLEEHGVEAGGPASSWPEAYTGEGVATASSNDGVSLDGRSTADAKATIIDWLESTGAGEGAVTYKLRDWLFSRQRYWGEPFPIVYDDDGNPHAVPDDQLPVMLPEVDDYAPRVVGDDDESVPEPPLGRAEGWREVTLDLGDGPRRYRRELNTMPNWAGSCWYYLRYLDPTNDTALVDPDVERYWMQGSRSDGTPAFGGVDLYVGGVEHAVLHLLYSRFWHKVLFDLGHVSTPEPFQRLYNQGYILAPAYTDDRGFYVEATSVVDEGNGTFTAGGAPVNREMGKMGKSLKNSVSPEDICRAYGTDTLRLYEMAMGPLDADRPWNARDIVGVHRFLQRLWRNVVDEETDALRVVETPAPDDLRRTLHRTIAGVADDMEGLRFNTAVAKLIELNNALGPVAREQGGAPREVAETMALLLAPLAPHVAEELWSRLGHTGSLVWADFPRADPALLVDETIELPVQVDGKVRARLVVAADAGQDELEAAALADERVRAALGDRTVRRVVVVPGRLVNVVAG